MERVPSQKEMRYDRQLRLWGDHGQHKLENVGSELSYYFLMLFLNVVLSRVLTPGSGNVRI